MSVTSFSRLGTANTYDKSIATLQSRQSGLSTLQEQLTSGKRVTTPSDDPTSAAQAERALNRIARIATDQRALEAQRNSIAQAEGTLGDVTDALQQVRELVVGAGNGAFSSADRKTIALQITGLRDRLIDLANTKDSNGQPLFAALGSALKPFLGPAFSPDYSFEGLAGSPTSGTYNIASTLDGESAFMLQPGRDAAYNVQSSTTSTGSTLITSGVQLVDTAAVPADASQRTYTISNMVVDSTDPANITIAYDLVDNLDGAVSGNYAGIPWSPALGFTVTEIPGISFTVTGTPTGAADETLEIQPNSSVFATVDKAINDIANATNSVEASQAVGQALHNIDISMGRVAAIRGQAGDLLNRADTITATNDKRNIEQEANRSRAEDLDMIKGISQFQNQQTGMQAALQSYAQIQRLSLFNYIS